MATELLALLGDVLALSDDVLWPSTSTMVVPPC